MGTVVGYIRVSTVGQSTERQLDGVALDKTFRETASARTADRPQLRAMIEYIREGDTVVVHDLSRLARSVADLHDLVGEITGKGATLRFVKEGLTFAGDRADPMSKLLLSMLGAVYQFEREIMLERQREGIAIARAKGKFKGRPAKIDSAAIKELAAAGKSIAQIADQLGVSKSSVQRAKRA